jgi:flagellar biosynthesis protein FliR
MQRMMPQVQLFLVTMPLQIWGGLFIFATTIIVMMGVWLNFFNENFTNLFIQ